MDRFFGSNPGFRSRIAHHVDFPDYSADELLAIGKVILSDRNYQLSNKAEEALKSYIDKRKEQPHFANARSIRNAHARL